MLIAREVAMACRLGVEVIVLARSLFSTWRFTDGLSLP